MLTKWKTSTSYPDKITQVSCSRETEKAVWTLERAWTIDGYDDSKPPIERRRMKRSDYENFHDTWEEAHAFLLARADRELESARRRLAAAQGTHGNVKGMRKPAETEQAA